jgi:hypothetical protein
MIGQVRHKPAYKQLGVRHMIGQVRHKPAYKQLGVRPTEHRFYTKIVADTITRN